MLGWLHSVWFERCYKFSASYTVHRESNKRGYVTARNVHESMYAQKFALVCFLYPRNYCRARYREKNK